MSSEPYERDGVTHANDPHVDQFGTDQPAGLADHEITPHQAATRAAHAAVYALVDDAVPDLESDVKAFGNITAKTIRLHMRLAADTALEAAAPHIADHRIAELKQLATDMLSRFNLKAHPGRPCMQSGMIDVEVIEQWRRTIGA